MNTLIFESEFSGTPEELWQWHDNPKSLERLIPPWENAEVLTRDRGLKKETILRLKLGPFVKDWVARYTDWNPPFGFEDTQEKGPFDKWRHKHEFLKKDNGVLMRDTIHYQVPLGMLGNAGAGDYVEKRLRKQFLWRHRRLLRDLEFHRQFLHKQKIIVSGASGLVGKEFIELMMSGGHEVIQLVRRPSLDNSEVSWDPYNGSVEQAARLEGADAWVHLGGANIADRKWSEEYKKQILESRVLSTRGVGKVIQNLQDRPKVWINASAIGFYGMSGEFDENSQHGEDFLAEVCQKWENAAQEMAPEGVRLVLPRIGVVISSKGGALSKLLPLYKSGLGGPIGRGHRKMSWIDLEELTKLLGWSIINDHWSGVFNAVSPEGVTSQEFSDHIANKLKRPGIFRAPPGMLRFSLGEMAEATILSSAEVRPKRLQEVDYPFLFPSLAESLKNQLG